MNKKIFDITAAKNYTCRSPEQFTTNYFKNSYYHLTFLTGKYDITSYNNTLFESEIVYENIQWKFSDLNSFTNLVKLARIINTHHKPIVFLHGFASPLPVFWLRIYLNKDVKIIVQHHAEKPYKNALKLYIQKMAYSGLEGYIFAAKKLSEQYSEKKIIKAGASIYEIMEGSTLFNLKDKQQCRENLNIDNRKAFIWVGRLDANKDPMTALEAFKSYKESGENFKLWMIFNSNELEPEVKNYILTHHLSDCINLIGETAHESLEDIYNAADYFISASHYEGSGYAMCEAMACGCIPIVTSIPSFYTMTNNGLLGKLFEPGNSEDLFQKLKETERINVDEERIKIRNYFEKELSFNAIAIKMDAAFKNAH